jgi:FHA domain
MPLPMQPIEGRIGENDDTAELPVLDVAAYEQSLEDDRNEHTDTWVSPHAIALDPPPDIPAASVPTLRPVPAEVDLGALSATLHAVEDRLRQKSDRLLALEREVADVKQDRSKRLAELEERGRVLERRIAELEETRAIAEAQHEAALIRMNTDLALQREQFESERQSRHVQVSEFEHELERVTTAYDEAVRRIRELEAQMSESAAEFEGQIGSRAVEYETKLAALVAEHEAKQRERAAEYNALTNARATEFAEHLAARVQEFDTQRAALESEWQSKLAEFTAERAGRESEWQHKLTERDNDVHVAEEALRRLEGELRSKNVKLEEMAKESSDWRETIAEAQRALSERDARIRQLETDVISTQAAFGKLQQNIERLDPVGATGEEIALEGPQRLLIRTDGNTDFIHVLGRRTRIGRGMENELVIEAQYISRNHAVLLAGPVHTTIEDLNSTNGVFVNNKRVTRQTLKDGDRVTIGRSHFRYSVRTVSDRE